MSRPTWHIEVDRETCLGTGGCAVLAADYFVLSGNRARAVESAVSPDEAVLDAAASCPVEAILVRDAATGRVLAPEE
ncbi:ferredoxin [Streptomyces sp. WMMC500]|uniref:ferredoxin n=1 Tax=Streptomyces sp. WMMC500 TaxID=3015154 RepID=UPI00248C1586|nr:ferredoxin [Streptomyces sp. WMMC500]WBB61281.1 ferredoxin [Streptomyces sp. WMMC500]